MQLNSWGHMTQKETAEVLGVTRPKMTVIMVGSQEGFKLEHLIMTMTVLSWDVDSSTTSP